MANNVLETRFVFDDRDGKKIDLVRKNLIDLNNEINNLGKNTVVGKNFKSIGENVVSGLTTGINSQNQQAQSSIGNLVDGLIKKAKLQLGIRSPSLVFRQIGGHIVDGLQVGISSGASALTVAMGNLLGGLAANALTQSTALFSSAGRSVLDYSSKLEQARIGLTTMTGSADIAASHLKDLQNFAKTTPFEFSELVAASQKLQGVGFSAQKVIPVLRDVGSSLAASGRISESPFAIKALGDIQAKGKLAGQEIIQLSNAGIPAIKVLSSTLNKSSAEILKLSENGQISSEVFLNALHQYSQSNFGGALEAQSRTFAGAISNIKDALGQTSEVAFRPLYEKVSAIANDITVEISKHENDLEKVGIAIGSNIAKGIGTIISDSISNELQNIGQGKSNPTSTYFEIGGIGNDFRKGLLGDRGSVKENLESSYNLTFGQYKNRTAGDLDQLNLEIRDTETINYFGRLNNELSKLYEEKNEILKKIINPDAVQNALTDGIKLNDVTYTFDKATNTLVQTADAAKTLTNNLSDAGKEAAKLADSINKFKLSEVDSYLNYGKAEILNNNGGNKSLQTLREIAELEQSAIKEKIRLTKQLAGEQIKALTPEERGGQKGSEISLNAVAQVNDLMRRGKTLEFETQKSITDEIRNTEKRVKDLGKAYSDVFSNLSVRVNASNPFVSVFSEARTELDKLKDSIKGLPEELQRAAIQSQQTLNRNKLFETRLDNNLSAFDLRETANRFRNPQSDTLVDKQIFEEVVKNSISRGNFFNGAFGSFGSNLSNRFGGFDKLNDLQKRDIYEVEQLKFLRGDGGVNDRSLISRLARERAGGSDQNLSLNERLQKQLSIINSGVSNESERGIADRRLIGLTSGLDPSQIKTELREQIAAANEREAVRKEGYERELLSIERENLAINKKIADAQEKLLKIAEKDGLEGLNNYLEITVLDKTGGGVSTGSAGTQEDVRRTYFE